MPRGGAVPMAERLAQYKRDGYTVFEGMYGEAEMARWRAEQDRLEDLSVGMFAPSGANESPARNYWFGNMLERSPALMWPAVNNPAVLDFAEEVVGPLVQLDNLTLAAFPPVPRAKRDRVRGRRASGWHRDRWGRMPGGAYDRPLSFNAICYLQDLTDDTGPLRVIPGSHVAPVAIPAEQQGRPHADEQLLYLKAGDLIMTHSGLLHSGTPNLSDGKRYFFSVYYNISWLKQTDTFVGPSCVALKAWARKRRDRRALRLLGADPLLEARANSGFQASPDEERWARWAAEDRAAMGAHQAAAQPKL